MALDFGLNHDVTNREHFKTVKKPTLEPPAILKRLETMVSKASSIKKSTKGPFT
jgi:hypothetical protein